MIKINENTDFQKGVVLLIDKEYGWTSFDVVKKIRSIIRKKFGYHKIKVGHAGTLDPLATGLIIICTGCSNRTWVTLATSRTEPPPSPMIRSGLKF